MRPAVCVDNPPYMCRAFEDEDHAVRLLEDLEWKRSRIHAWNTGRQAQRLRIVLRQIRLMCIVKLFRFRFKRNIDQLLYWRAVRPAGSSSRKIHDGAGIPGALAIPQVGLAVGEARRR